jgi:hypothetical protein
MNIEEVFWKMKFIFYRYSLATSSIHQSKTNILTDLHDKNEILFLDSKMIKTYYENNFDEVLDKQINSYELEECKLELFDQILGSETILHSGFRLRKIARRKIKIPKKVLEKLIETIAKSKMSCKDKNVGYLIQTLKYSLLNGNNYDENEFEELIEEIFKLVRTKNSNAFDLRIQILQCLYFVLKTSSSNEKFKEKLNALLPTFANQIDVSQFHFALKKNRLEQRKATEFPKWILPDKLVKPTFITKTLFKANHRNRNFLSEEFLALGSNNTDLLTRKRKYNLKEVTVTHNFAVNNSDENKSDWLNWSYFIENIEKFYGKVKSSRVSIKKKDLDFMLKNFSALTNRGPRFVRRFVLWSEKRNKYLDNILPFMVLETLLETVKLDNSNQRTSLNATHVIKLVEELNKIFDFKFKHIDTRKDRESVIKFFREFDDVSNKNYPPFTKKAFRVLGATATREHNLENVFGEYLNECRSCVFEISKLLCRTVHRDIILQDAKLKENVEKCMNSDIRELKKHATDFYAEYRKENSDKRANKIFFKNRLDSLLKDKELSKAKEILQLIESDSNRDYLELCKSNLVKIGELIVIANSEKMADIFYLCISKYNLKLFDGDTSSILSMNICIANSLKLENEYIISIFLDILLHHVQGENHDDEKLNERVCKVLCEMIEVITEQTENSTR